MFNPFFNNDYKNNFVNNESIKFIDIAVDKIKYPLVYHNIMQKK